MSSILEGALDASQFLQGITASTPKQRGDGEDQLRLNKLHMNARPNQGRVTFIPYQGKEGFYMFFTRTEHEDNRIKELRVYSEEFEDWVWFKILPKKYYGQMTPEQESLYDEVVSKYEHVQEEELLDREDLRVRSYGLHYGYVLSHSDREGQPVKEPKLGPNLIVIPSAAAPGALSQGIGDMSSQAGGDTSWISIIFNNMKTERKGAIVLYVAKGSGFGYDVKYSMTFANPPMVNVPPADFSISEDEFGLFDSILKSFMGWQWGEGDSAFNKDVFDGLKWRLDHVIAGDVTGSNDTQTNLPPVTQSTPVHIDPLAGINASAQAAPQVPPVAPSIDPMLQQQAAPQVPPVVPPASTSGIPPVPPIPPVQ